MTDAVPAEVPMSLEIDMLLEGADPVSGKIDEEPGPDSTFHAEHAVLVDTVPASFPLLPNGVEEHLRVLEVEISGPAVSRLTISCCPSSPPAGSRTPRWGLRSSLTSWPMAARIAHASRTHRGGARPPHAHDLAGTTPTRARERSFVTPTRRCQARALGAAPSPVRALSPACARPRRVTLEPCTGGAWRSSSSSQRARARARRAARRAVPRRRGCSTRSRPPEPRPLPTCFVLELASGAFRPRAPTPREAPGEPEPEPTTAELDGAQLEVCHAGACRALAILELAADDGPLHATAFAASDDGRLAAAIFQRGGTSRGGVGHAIIHDVATGRRIGRAELGGAYSRLRFLGDTLLVTNQFCAEPCLPSWLVDPRTGKRRAAVGGAQPLLASQITAARVAGDLWAFHGRGAPAIVLQDVRTGRVAARVDRPAPCQSDQAPHACDLRLLHAGGGLAILEKYRDASRVTVLDVRGAIVARHQVPLCKP